MGKPGKVTDKNFRSEVLESGQPVLVDFWAPWCGPCRMVGPIVEELADEYDGRVKVVKVNTDENVDTIIHYGVQSIPTLILFKDGEPFDHVVGFRPKNELQRVLDEALTEDTVSAGRA